MGLDHQTAQSQHRRSAVACDVEFLEQPLESRFDQQGSDFGGDGGHQCGFDLFKEHCGKSFIELEDNIAHKRVAHDNIRSALGDLPGFYIADKIDPLTCLEKRKDFFYKCISLFFLRAYIDKGHSRVFDPCHVFHVDRAHLGKLDQLGGTGIYIRTAVYQKDRPLRCGKKRSQRRPLDPADPSDQKLSACKGRAGAARCYKGIAGALFDEPKPLYNRRILLFPDRIDR